MTIIAVVCSASRLIPLCSCHYKEPTQAHAYTRAMHLGDPITSRSNARVKALRAALSGKARQPGELVGIEGEHAVIEAHAAGVLLETIFLRQGSEALLDRPRLQHLNNADADIVLLTAEVFDSAVTTATPQPIAAICRIPDKLSHRSPGSSTLILEDLQDPGNVGTLIRSAEAFGADSVMITPGTANHWSPKALRSSAGSAFRVPVVRLPIKDILTQLRGEGVRIFAAVSGFLSGPDYGVPIWAARHGVLTGRIDNADAPPELRRPDFLDPADPTIDTYAASSAHDTDFTHPWAILIGNEGAGLSTYARRCADEQVMIPHCGSESLNAAVAGSVLMYEASRQILLRMWARKQGLRP
jgi:TrmH family RNA methyltransferase